jgi:hypothetical protein
MRLSSYLISSQLMIQDNTTEHTGLLGLRAGD